MATVYSRLLFRAHAVDTDTVAVYTFPAGYLYVVRDMDVFLAGEGGGAFSVYDGASCTFWSVTAPEGGTGFWEHWSGRQVFEAGDSVSFAPSTIDPFGHGDIRVSGYALTLP